MHPLSNHSLTDPVLLTANGPLTAATFFAQINHLAAQLPDAPYVINLCETRHAFMVAFAAVLLRGQISLLPPAKGMGDRQQLQAQYPNAYLLTDSAIDGEKNTQSVFNISPILTLDLAQTPIAPTLPCIPQNQLTAILFTSGSTGQPSAHPKTWGQLYQGAQNLAHALRWPHKPPIAIIGSIPPQHMFGLETTVILPLYLGIPVHAEKPLLPADLDIAIQQCSRPVWWMTTPMHLRTALHNTKTAHPIPSLQGIIASTMNLPLPLAQAVEQNWQVPVTEIYGSTETGALATRRTAQHSHWQPLPHITLTVGGNPPQPTGAAPVWASGGHVGTPVALNDHLDIQPNGSFLWLGRKTDLIKIAGKRASLAALNQQLIDIPGVEDGVYYDPQPNEPAATIDHPTRRLVAFVVTTGVTPQHILKTLRTRIDAVFLPRPIYPVEALPRNANGKLTQAALADLHQQCRKKHDPLPPTQTVPAHHPALPGHFPGNPIVPGALLLAEAYRAVQHQFPTLKPGTLISARFHTTLKPGEPYRIHAQQKNQRIHFEIQRAHGKDDTLIASGQWACTPSETPGP